MKPEYIGMEEGPYTDWYECLICECQLLRSYNCCPKCGIIIDWSGR